MGIIWQYLDKRGATANALRDYGRMEFIISHTDDEIKAAYQKMGGISSPQPDGMPHTHNPHAAEDRMVKGIEEIDVLKERYREAVEFMAWFGPAWEQLTEDDRYVLECFYMGGNEPAVNAVCERFQIERNSAYRRKNRALSKLSVMLYGK